MVVLSRLGGVEVTVWGTQGKLGESCDERARCKLRPHWEPGVIAHEPMIAWVEGVDQPDWSSRGAWVFDGAVWGDAELCDGSRLC